MWALARLALPITIGLWTIFRGDKIGPSRFYKRTKKESAYG